MRLVPFAATGWALLLMLCLRASLCSASGVNRGAARGTSEALDPDLAWMQQHTVNLLQALRSDSPPPRHFRRAADPARPAAYGGTTALNLAYVPTQQSPAILLVAAQSSESETGTSWVDQVPRALQ